MSTQKYGSELSSHNTQSERLPLSLTNVRRRLLIPFFFFLRWFIDIVIPYDFTTSGHLKSRDDLHRPSRP